MLRTLLFLLLLLSQSVSAQTIYRGIVQDAESKKPIPYVTIGLVKENIGATSGEDGRFELSSDRPQLKDSLLFQGLGYASFKVAAASWQNWDVPILLQSVAREIDEVRISPKTRPGILNPYNKKANWGYFVARSASQVAQHYRSPFANSIKLDKAIIHIESAGLFSSKQQKFRLRVYQVDTATGGPGEDVSTQSIIVTTKGGKVLVDLTPYNIVLSEKDFFIAVEWLLIPENEYFIKSLADGRGLKRLKYYNPELLMLKPQQDTTNNIWLKNYRGGWQKMPTMRTSNGLTSATNFAIEAEVRY